MPTTTSPTLGTGVELDAGGDPHVVVIASPKGRAGYATVIALSASADTFHRFAVWNAYPVHVATPDVAAGWQVETGGYHHTLSDAIADYVERTGADVSELDARTVSALDVAR
jgi:hypothetical protein